MEITVRTARPDDFESIARLNHEELHYDFPPLETYQRLVELLHRKSHLVVVAEADGVVVGYLHACDYDLIYADPLKNVMGIAVSERFRHRGAGSLLLKAVEQWAERTGAAGVRIASGEERQGAHAFYRACGYLDKKRKISFEKIL